MVYVGAYHENYESSWNFIHSHKDQSILHYLMYSRDKKSYRLDGTVSVPIYLSV